jgi:hypothetical protein
VTEHEALIQTMHLLERLARRVLDDSDNWPYEDADKALVLVSEFAQRFDIPNL